jgi:DNA topoisomerase-3
MTVSVLMVAEKPSIATSIASALCFGQQLQSRKSPPIYDFEGKFKGMECIYRITSVTGHVFSLDFPPSYQQWDSVEPVDLFKAPVMSTAEGKGAIVKHLEKSAINMDYLVLWLDCDREGENICFEVIRCVEKHMNRDTKGQKIYRAKFSAVTSKDIEKAMLNLGVPNENESKAVEARQELDLKVGVAFSRFQTRYFQGKYGDLDSSVISYGPCQTPTLGFCVNRHDEIQTFVPESFWTLDIIADTVGSLDWGRHRIFNEEICSFFLSLMKEETSLICIELKETESKRSRPKPMNTVELLKLASKTLGIGPHATMRAAEQLYLSGYLSYPRTESTSYPKSFDFNDALNTLKGHSEYSSYIRDLITSGYESPHHGHDAGDHPPITPVGLANSLHGDNARIYDLVVRHFLATISPDAVFLVTKLTYKARKCNEIFSISGKKEIDPGFMEIYYKSSTTRDPEIRNLPEVIVGSIVNISYLKLKQGLTSAPGYLTESELISLMEKYGIGTDASIPSHINNVIVRNYVTLGSGRTLIPTSLGIVLVHGYKRIDPDLVLPDVRSAIELFCNEIAKGNSSKEHVVSHSLTNFEEKFKYFCSKIELMDSLFEASFSPLAATGKFLSKCGKCSRYMR